LDLDHIPRVDNAIAADLSTKASNLPPVSDGVLERRVQRPTARPAELGERGEASTSKLAFSAALIPWSPSRIIGVMGYFVHPSAQDPEAQLGPDTWITKIQTDMKESILPNDHASANRIVHVAKRYTLVEGDLYRCGTNSILMQCITQEEGRELLTEVHGGECQNHAPSRTLVGKGFRHGFYCPTTILDAVKLVKTCRACQFHAKQIHTPV
jgi:hypothetical protein